MPEVLIVDDDQAIREAIREALTDSGIAVQEARDGIAALAILRESPPLVVLLDQHMPRMDGFTVLQTVAAEGDLASRHTYFLLTGNPQVDAYATVQVRPGFAVGVVPKPFDLFDLIERVEQSVAALKSR